ncbi:hypothetical protein [Nocardia pneumoniae]|uniref:hypothetical protein n=1 Tax=Nocardia pneumoniae TaxID=228601 RepID=UPI000A04AA3D|nr:hypothetical protein [Nocardia pneumoniae]
MLYVDEELVDTLVNGLIAIAEESQQDLDELTGILAREGRPWGDDEPGRMINDAFEPRARETLDGYQNLVDNLHRLSAGISRAVDSFGSQDQDGANQIENTGFGMAAAQQLGTQPAAMRDVGVPQSVVPLKSFPPVDYGQVDEQQTAPDAGSLLEAAQPAAGLADFSQPPVGGHDRDDSSPRAATPPTGMDPVAQQNVPGSAPNWATGTAGRSAARPAPHPVGSAMSAATNPHGVNAPIAPKHATTPWSEKPGTRRGVSSAVSSPWSRIGPGNHPPSRVFAPAPAGPGAAAPAGPGAMAGSAERKRNDRARNNRRTSDDQAECPVPTDPVAIEAIWALATKHGLLVQGFDGSGITVDAVAEITSAFDHILGRYPFLEIGGIEIAGLGGKQMSDVEWGRFGTKTVGRRGKPWIQLDRVIAADPALLAEKVDAAIHAGMLTVESANRPIYGSVVNAIGQIMESSAGPRPRRSAQRTLITEYHRLYGPWNKGATLAGVVHGYREWRNRLGGRSIIDGRFQPRSALLAAFAEVELCADACQPAKPLHRLLVECARGRSKSAEPESLVNSPDRPC